MITIIFVLSSIATVVLFVALVCLIGYRSQQTKPALPTRPKMRAPCVPCGQCMVTRKNVYTNVSQQAQRERRFSWERIQTAYGEIERIEQIKTVQTH